MHSSNSRLPSSSTPQFSDTQKATRFFYPFRFHAQSTNFLNIKNPPFFKSLNSVSKPLINNPSLVSCSAVPEALPLGRLSVSDKVKFVASEFKNLVQPIDRVKRLLHYAALLGKFESPALIEENRVKGCTAQVWLEVKMDNDGLMRFKVDSDSEITKGFCSCLIWILDGGEPEEILSVKIDDLFDMNVGMPSRGNSRVNTWHNVLISMQKRTKDLILERDRIRSLDTGFSSLFDRSNCMTVNGRCTEAQV